MKGGGIMQIFEFIKSNSSTIWSGCGVALLLIIFWLIPKLIKFSRTHKIIEKSEYNDLIKIKSNYIDADKLKNGLEFNHDSGIYIDKETDEKYCPTCLTNKKRRNHLQEEVTEYGDIYRCPVCPQIFTGKIYQRRLDEAIKAENNMNYMDWSD